MSVYESTATADQLAERIRAAGRILLTTHVKPDGDALGSVLAIARALRDREQTIDIYLMGPLEPGLASLAGDTPCHLVEEGRPGDDYDLIIVVDTGAWSQLEPLADWLRNHRERVVGVDHHAHGDDVAPQRIVDVNAASTTQALVPVLDALGCEISGGLHSVAEALYLGLATDTGWFKYSNADAAAFQLASRLIERGVDKSHLYQLIEECFRSQRLHLQARALSSVQFLRGGEVAIMSLGAADFRETEGDAEDAVGLVNLPMSVAAVKVSIFMTELVPGTTKLSFRSKPDGTGRDAPAMDVNELAKKFGGGGHVQAAGARVAMPLAQAIDAVSAAVEEI